MGQNLEKRRLAFRRFAHAADRIGLVCLAWADAGAADLVRGRRVAVLFHRRCVAAAEGLGAGATIRNDRAPITFRVAFAVSIRNLCALKTQVEPESFKLGTVQAYCEK